MKFHHPLAIIAALAALAWTPSPVHAWSAEGHRIVCEIAWQRLTPAARTMVSDLLRDEEDRVFARHCAWADQVRGTTHRHTAAYHYINIPAGAAGTDLARDCGDADRRCVTWAIDRYARILADRRAPHAERNEALKFVAHFVGDLHQPLHAGRPEDLGGNRIPVRFYGDPEPAGHPLNLHAAWDGTFLRHAGIGWPEGAQRLHERIPPAEARRWQTLDLIGWTDESFLIADRFAYPALPADGYLGNAYVWPALAYSEVMLQKAGVRLAYLLNHAAAGTLRLPDLPV
jgi:nuclease S1